MSYYGLPPTKFANEYNEFEKLLRVPPLVEKGASCQCQCYSRREALPLDGAIKALDLLETITRNTAQNPQDEKFRRVRTTNEKLSALFGLPGIIPVMECMGWQQDGELPKSVKLDFPQHVVKILEAKSHFGKLQESEKRAAKLAQDPNKAELLKQLELDRRERGPEAPAAAQAMSEEEQLQEALKLSMETASATSTTEGQSEGSSPKDESPTPEPAPKTVESAVPAPPAPAPSAPVSGAPKGEKKVQDPAKKRQEQEMSLADIRAMQKQKFKELREAFGQVWERVLQLSPFQGAYKRPADIAPGGSEEKGWFDWMWGGSSSSGGEAFGQVWSELQAYKRPAAIAPGGSEEKGWFDWMWGGSSSSGGYGGGGGGKPDKPDKPDRQGPKMKTFKDALEVFENAKCLVGATLG
ncbi:hypothetical protein AK812_SmicGene3455 [Symbiodinium microadriaticum]|uniref:PUB domain-containing protein n=1 Tax=Symbiodinium microadriaticum TaxID=2951 RepID=A0A1Q9EZ30_SYMMI|nr:hypothetical protein AK812_SmicGene3455 [Symbiodinium microadriaticum]